ncbi:hypothetical protein N0B31_18370 [Salinirubellus salinus]|uniref:Uncharacterized protein n=1 Tax=Salinirubellus salinus TaxID=1364945 RepID=A0A9E7R1W3_9EURY|nr:hypothetical protein [Salinirubellus salinus]UWM54071.1 hypothetical protein N0B31_18370 [Salinirubellus salinus]
MAEEPAGEETDVSVAAVGGTRLSAPGTFTLVWGLSALALAAIDAADGVGTVAAFATVAGLVAVLAVLADFAFDRRPGTTVFLFVGVPALLGAGLAGFEGRLLSAVGLAVVGVAMLGRVYGLPGEDDPTVETGDAAEERED